MREKGVANTTTKNIAAAAGYSEAMLYKHFADKQELFLLVLKERLPGVRPKVGTAGSGDLAENLTTMIEQLLDYFAELFPMSVSVFSSPELLKQHRDGVRRHGGRGPEGAVNMVERYLEAERQAGRITKTADAHAAAQLLVVATFHQGFLAAFEGHTVVADGRTVAAALVAVVLPSLVSPQP
jgi:AcrR family transcriptional regulator